METSTEQRISTADAYRESFEQSAIDAAFLWMLRSIAVEGPHYTVNELAQLERRIDANLDVLMSSTDQGWAACVNGLSIGEPGEIFTATVVAMRSHELAKIQTAVQTGFASGAYGLKSLVAAFGWLPAELARPWIERLLNGKEMNHKYLGLAACSVRRQDPGALLGTMLQRQDCRAHVPVYARALRLVGELRRLDLMPALQMAVDHPQPAIAFWANWSLVLLGQHAQVKNLRPFAARSDPHQARSIQLAFRVLPVDMARDWISAMAKDPTQTRAVVSATGVLGDAHAVNWLIDKMYDPTLARVAAEAFTCITGIDLIRHGAVRTAPTRATDDEPTMLDDDAHLPWPDADKVRTLWQQHSSHFLVGRRYLLGKPITIDWLKQVIRDATMRQRHAAALELALIDSNLQLANTRARCFYG